MRKSSRFMAVLVFLSSLIGPAATHAQEVGPGGSFHYSYPIEVPPGLNGMGPQLALSYDSGGGNGFVGMGFSLQGLAVIARDGRYPVTFSDTTDHFCYNGQKLIADSLAADLFHLEREDYIAERRREYNRKLKERQKIISILVSFVLSFRNVM